MHSVIINQGVVLFQNISRHIYLIEPDEECHVLYYGKFKFFMTEPNSLQPTGHAVALFLKHAMAYTFS